MKRANTRVQSFPSPDPNPAPHDILMSKFDPHITPKLHNLPVGRPISADRLADALDFFMASKEIAPRLTVNAISTIDCNLIRFYLDNINVILLDACSTMQHTLQNTRRHLGSVQIALHYLEGEHEPSSAVLNRAAAALESCDFKGSIELEKCMSKLRALCKKLSEHALDQGISPELYRALSGSWAMGVLAVGMLGSATSFRPQVQPSKADPWAVLLNELSRRMKKNPVEEGAAMEELKGTVLAAQALLKLVSEWQKCDSGGLRRAAVKAVAGQLLRKSGELAKALQPLEEKIGKLYRQLVEFRMRLLVLLSEAHKEEVVLDLVNPTDIWREGQMDFNPAQLNKAVNWVRIKPKSTKKSWSLGRIGGGQSLGFTFVKSSSEAFM